MFDFNNFKNAQPFSMYLCKPNGKVICELNGIRDESASFAVNLGNENELTFDYDKYINVDGDIIESNGYNKLSTGMRIFIPEIGFLKLEHPKRCFDGDKHYKSITAHSIDCEFENKYLTEYKINTGEETSQEYLVTYEEGETESLLNEYTGIPYDFIVFDNTFPQELAKIRGKYSDGKYTDSATIDEIKKYCDLVPRLKSRVITTDESSILEEYVIYTYDSSGENITSVELVNFNARIEKLIDFYTKYHDQLSLIPLTLNMTGCDWTVGEIDPSLANKKFKFDVTTNVYAFFTQDVAGAAECVFDFDLLHKKINVRLIENIGKSSDVFIDKYNLLNNMEISCEENHLYTRYTVSGGNDMDIKDVNFGDNIITDLTYQMKVRDDDGELIYVTEELAEKYFQYVADREIAREKYIELKTQYNQLLMDVDELKYKVPDDVCKTAWGTYSMEELEAADKSYTNLLNTLLTLYKEEYGTNGLNEDGSVKESVMIDTIYWNDYKSYQQALVQIKAAAEALNSGSNYSQIKDGTNQDLIKAITAYETQWDLYGTIELQNKIYNYNNQLKCCIQKGLVLYDNSETAIPWGQLSPDQKKDFQDPVSYGVIYDEYKKALENRNNCQTYLDTLLAQVSEKESQMKQYKKQYSDIIKLVSLQGYNRTELCKIVALENPNIGATFTADDIRAINLLYVDNTYSNENILTTSLDNIVTQIDVERELLADAKEKLSAASQPQMTYSIDMDAILCMPEFKDYEFMPGNFVYVEYMDDYYVKLRLFTMQFNPRIPYDPPKVTFTNYVSSRAKRSDLSYILAQASGSGSGGGSSSGGFGGSGAFGTGKDIDVTISNTMLAKMLNTELFATRVTDVVLDNAKINNLNAKMATFGGLADGTTIIDGKCIKTSWIIDSKYNGDKAKGTITNTEGTIINLNTGSFSFAGGRIKFDADTNKLTFGSDVTLSWSQVTGTDDVATKSDATTISRNEISTATIKAGQIKTGTIVSTDGSTTKINLDDGTFSFAGGKLTWNKTTLSVTGDITTGNLSATGGSIGGWTITTNDLYNSDAGMSSNGSKYAFWAGESNSVHGASGSNAVFRVGHNGAMVATKATIAGNITADSIKLCETIYIKNTAVTNTNGYAQLIHTNASNKNINLGVLFSTLTVPTLVPTGNVIMSNYGSGIEFYTSWGVAGIKSLSNGSTLNLFAQKTGSTSWSDSISLIGSDGTIQIATKNHTHSYLPLSGGTLTGPLQAKTQANGDASYVIVTHTTANYYVNRIWCSATSTLSINGRWNSTSNSNKTIAISSSDIRLKENIIDSAVNALPVINQMKLREFDWKDHVEHQKIGFVADELQSIDSRLAIGGGYDENGIMNEKTVDTFYLLGYVVKAIQELSEENKKLKQEILQLKNLCNM